MSGTARLERWYRRMLAWYPAEHRRAYGEEMIGVLLASAPQGRRRPGIADTLDLIKGGLLARLRPAGGDIDAGWRDTFAVFSIAAPVAALAFSVSWTVTQILADLLATGTQGSSDVDRYAVALGTTLLMVLAIAVPPLLALRGLRRTALLIAAIPAVFFGYFAVSQAQWAFSRLVWCAFLFPIEVLALAISPGPKRGAKLMTKWAQMVVTAAAVLSGLAASLPGLLLSYFQPGFEFGYLAPRVTVISVPVIAVAAAAGLILTLPAPIGWHLLLLLAIPFYPAVIAITGLGALTSPDGGTLYGPDLSYPPAIALACLVAVLAWRSRHRDSTASQHSGPAAS